MFSRAFGGGIGGQGTGGHGFGFDDLILIAIGAAGPGVHESLHACFTGCFQQSQGAHGVDLMESFRLFHAAGNGIHGGEMEDD